MASAKMQCDICESLHISKTADVWCPQCQERLCSECNIHHSVSKFTKKHQVVFIDNYQQLPKYVSSIVPHCEDHDHIYTNYCSHHECLCCPECIKDHHKNCNSLLLIKDILQNSKSSALLESIQENIVCLKYQYEEIILEQDKNLKENNKQRDKFLIDIKELRKYINDHLDKLEKTMTESINDAVESIKTNTIQLKDELEKRKQAVYGLENDINVTKRHATDLQMCLSIKSFQTKIEEEEKYLSSLLESGWIKIKRIKFDINEQLRGITTLIESLGTLTTKETTIPFKHAERERRAQITSRPQSTVKRSVRDMNVALKSKLEVPVGAQDCCITGCVIRSDGKMVLVNRDRNRKLLILTADGKLEKEKQYSPGSNPTDVTVVDDKTICVSFFDIRLEMIDTTTYKTTQVIKTDNPCCGVTSDGENLIWYEKCKGIQIKQKSSDTITTLLKDNSGYYWSYLTVHNDKIYQTHNDNHNVTCYRISGEKVWEFKDPSVIEYPRGITVDNDSNVYVTTDSHKVVVLSPDGKTSRVLLTSDDGLDFPFGIYFDKSENILLVTNDNGRVFLYNVS